MPYCILKIIDEFGEIEKIYNPINSLNLKDIIAFSQMLGLKWLSSIDEADCNIFNIKQLHELKKELTIVEKTNYVDKRTLTTLLNAVNNCLLEKNYTYLKLSPVDKDNSIYSPFQQLF